MTKLIPTIHEEKAREKALGALRTGGVVVLPTDTLYGFSCRVEDEAAVERIAAIKQSPGDRRFILLASSVGVVDDYAASFGCAARSVMERVWPAPVTVVLPSGKRLPPWCGPTTAFRVPALPPLLDLLASLGEPVVSTSVNRSGNPPMMRASDIFREFSSEVDLVVAGDEKGLERASTVVDLTGKEPMVLRRGDYDWAAAVGNPSNE
jgi:L-threonylcarbamoyladenylate synthase